MTIVDIANLCIGFAVGAIAAFLVSWYWVRKYWVRKYGADLEAKVKDTADKVAEKIKEELQQKIEEIKAK